MVERVPSPLAQPFFLHNFLFKATTGPSKGDGSLLKMEGVAQLVEHGKMTHCDFSAERLA